MFTQKKKSAKCFIGLACKKCGSQTRMESNKRCYPCAVNYIQQSKEKKVEYCLKNKATINAKRKKWYKENRDYELAYRKYHKDNNKEAYYLWQKEHQKKNPEIWRYYSSKRRSFKLKATPNWANFDKIKEIYLQCPKGYEVDHIIPLQGKNVCGLHVENNLQYLSISDNRRKSNK